MSFFAIGIGNDDLDLSCDAFTGDFLNIPRPFKAQDMTIEFL